MVTTTTVYGFQKPAVAGDEDAWGGYLNNNIDKYESILTGNTTITSVVITTADINGGTLDNVVIGGTTAAAVTGTTITADSLTVNGTAVEVASINSTQNGAQINFDSASTSNDWSLGISNSADGDFLIYQNAHAGAGDILLYTNGSERMRIASSGATTFESSITAKSTSVISYAGYAGFEYHNTSGQWEGYVGTENNTGNLRYNSRQGVHKFYSNGTQRVVIESDGDVGIGGAVVPT